MNTHPLISAALAMPKTHKVVTTYADGRTREFCTRSEQTAENHAVLDRRNIGRVLIEREFPHRRVTIVNVSIVKVVS